MATYRYECTCPICGESYKGTQTSGGHCASCCSTFANDATGDAHRVGPHEPRGARRCLTVAEMLAGDWPERKSTKPPVPWRLTDRGWTRHPKPDAETATRMGWRVPQGRDG